MKHKPGTVVEVDWGSRPDVYYVRGHETADDDAVEAASEAAVDFLESEERPRLGIGRRLWARWIPATAQDKDECGQDVTVTFRVQNAPGRGAFEVVEVVDLDLAEQERERRRQVEDHVWELEGMVSAWFPEAEDIKAHGYPPGEGSVHFRLPGLAGDVRFAKSASWSKEPKGWHCWIQRRDLESWEALYADRKRPPMPCEASP